MASYREQDLEQAKVIVAIDFGTTYSGFSFIHTEVAKTDPENFLDGVEGFDRWPSQDKAGARPYFKTLTGLLYMQRNASEDSAYKLLAWGWEADVQHAKLLKQSKNSPFLDGKRFHLITEFKLALASENAYGTSYSLPQGFKVEVVIADYLQKLSEVIEEELKNKYGGHLRKRDIRWCLTVPAIWDDTAKQRMKKCAEIAGLVLGPSNKSQDGSPHPVIIVLEPEAASVFCLHNLKKIHKIHLAEKRKVLIVDAGGGTVDLVLHETVNSEASGSHQVKEICSGSSGGLCGSTFVDDAFYRLASRKIICYEKYMSENPSARSSLRKEWENHKVSFDGEQGCTVWLTASISRYWEKYCSENGVTQDDYDMLEITLEEMKVIFDFAVDPILELIRQQLNQVARETVDALVVVGGFSGSKYLMNRIHKEFDGKVQYILNPSHPGKAVVTGAVAYGCLGKEIVTARISKKTYGIRKKDLENLTRAHFFDVFVRNGEEVSAEYCVVKPYFPSNWERGVRGSSRIEVLSCTNRDPKRVTDLGVKSEYSFSLPFPSMKERPSFEVSMFFGRTSIEVTAVGKNFPDEKKISMITFEV